MKGRLVAFVGIFCIATLIASGAYAGKPDKGDKPGKPPRPGNIAVECITFLGPDLVGHQQVEGCCPNAGPFPEYRMTLWLDELSDDTLGKTFDGHLFAKPVRTKFKGQTTRRYLVQFNTWDWETEIPGDGDYFIEFYSDGDDIAYDETTDVLTVTFDNDHEDDTATVWVYYDMNTGCDPCNPPDCDLCVDFKPTCEDLCDPDCRPYPCNERIEVDVNFEMLKTTDLDYCE